MKSDKCPQVMSLESASVGPEDYKFENEKYLLAMSRKEASSPLLQARGSILD